MMEIITEGTVILTEFQKPMLNPSQVRPVQASLQALTQGAKVISTGGADHAVFQWKFLPEGSADSSDLPDPQAGRLSSE